MGMHRRTAALSGAAVLALGVAGVVLSASGVSSALPGSGAPSTAPGGTVIRVSGVSFPDPSRAQLAFVGCTDLYARTGEALQPMVGQGPGAAPSGNRSLAFDLAGGDAVGAAFPVDSMLGTTTASVAVHADGGSSTGVAWAGYQAPDDAGTGRMWLGRAPLSTPAGAWQTVDVTGRAYVWTQLDMTTHAVTAAGPTEPETVAQLAAAHGGDGPGLYTVGFGCDGTPFNIDDVRIGTASGTTTYDLEGLSTSLTMHASRPVSTGGPVTLRGGLTTDTRSPVPAATLLLEQSASADGPWRPVGAVPVRNGVATTTVQPDERTWYRWRFVDRPLASGSVSDAVAVTGSSSDDPSPSSGPSSPARPSSAPSPSPSADPTRTPSSTPSDRPTTGPTPGPTSGPSSAPSPTPTGQPTATGQPSPTAASPSPTQQAPTSPAPPSPAPSAKASGSASAGGPSQH